MVVDAVADALVCVMSTISDGLATAVSPPYTMTTTIFVVAYRLRCYNIARSRTTISILAKAYLPAHLDNTRCIEGWKASEQARTDLVQCIIPLKAMMKEKAGRTLMGGGGAEASRRG